MKSTKNTFRTVLFIGLGLLVIAALVLAVVIPLASRPTTPGGQTGATPTPQATTQPTTQPTPGDTAPTPEQGIKWGPQACPAAVADPAYWDTIIGTKSGVNKVESVSCANMLGNPSLQALVTVRASNSARTLDVYVYTNITSGKPEQLFKLQGLKGGSVQISGYNTVMTGEIDELSALNKGKASAEMTADLFREFKWSDGAGTLVQVAFPGLYPDLTRYQAELDQARVNKGTDTWKNDPSSVAKAFTGKFFQWARPVTTKVISGGGAGDVNAVVYVEEQALQGAQSHGPNVTVTLSRLEGNTHNMWVVIGAVDGKLLTLSNIQARSVITSPVTVQGVGAAFEGTIGDAVVFDHLYTAIGHERVYGQGIGISPYTASISYDTAFHRGMQEGIVAVRLNNGGISDEIATAVMVKVLLTPEPGIVLGQRPCPAPQNDPAYWNPYIKGYGPNTPVADSVACGNLVGQPTLQVMVLAHEIVGGGPVFRDVFVFDNIRSAHPVLLFKMQHLLHGDAKISGYSTITTAEVDIHSTLNAGKADNALQNDLFREFKWSDGAGAFVQTTFPGMFPDLTRYQAEVDQARVAQGAAAWKYNAATVAQKLAIQFFGWSSKAQATVISGGGAQDVGAMVQVVSTTANHPTILVELSRLEGNTHNIWEVIHVTSARVAITWPPNGALLNNPDTVKGTGYAFEGVVGKLFVLDHLYNQIGSKQVIGDNGMGATTFSTSISYATTFHGGAQEGILALYTYSNLNGEVAGVVWEKVMISG